MYICGEIVGTDPPAIRSYQASFSPSFCLVLLNCLVMNTYNNLKQCSLCREFKDPAEFGNSKGRTDGKYPNCRLCESKRNKERYNNNIEHYRKLKRDQANKFKTQNKKRQQKWYLENKGQVIIRTAEYKKRNPEYWRIYRKEYAQNNRENTRERHKRYMKTDKGKMILRQTNHNRNAKIRGAQGSHTYKEWEEMKRLNQYTCVHCGKKEPEIKLTRDHIQPISKGGTNYIANIQPLCGRCNSKKHNKSETEVKKCRAVQKCLLL